MIDSSNDYLLLEDYSISVEAALLLKPDRTFAPHYM